MLSKAMAEPPLALAMASRSARDATARFRLYAYVDRGLLRIEANLDYKTDVARRLVTKRGDQRLPDRTGDSGSIYVRR